MARKGPLFPGPLNLFQSVKVLENAIFEIPGRIKGSRALLIKIWSNDNFQPKINRKVKAILELTYYIVSETKNNSSELDKENFLLVSV